MGAYIYTAEMHRVLVLVLSALLITAVVTTASSSPPSPLSSNISSPLTVAVIEPLHPLCTHCSDGESVELPVLKTPSDDCFSGHFIRVPVNSSCHCHFICSHSARQSCRLGSVAFDHAPTTITLCDRSLNLDCNERTNRCEGPLRLEVKKLEARRRSFVVNWRRPKGILDEPTIEIAEYLSPDVISARFVAANTSIVRHPNTDKFSAEIVHHVRRSNVLIRVTHGKVRELAIYRAQILQQHNPTTDASTTASTRPQKDELSSTVTTPTPITVSSPPTSASSTTTVSTPVSLPKVLVTAQNASSISIAFDDFKAFDDHRGYRILFRPLYGAEDWSTLLANSSVFYVLDNLSPSTEYQIRVLTWDAEATSSEVISASTLAGCRHLNRTFEIDQEIDANCERRCVCTVSAQVHCSARCPEPLVSIAVANTTGVQCAPTPLSSSTSDEQCCCEPLVTVSTISSSANENFNGKPGECPANDGASSIGNPSSCHTTEVVHECSHDYHCTGLNKCCTDQCGQRRCRQSTGFVDANDSIKSRECHDCGAHATCQLIASGVDDLPEPVCVCDVGFEDHISTIGCSVVATRSKQEHRCEHHNSSYAIGQTFEQNCERCLCSEALEIECQSKCALSQRHPTPLPPGCSLEPDTDSVDSECCRKLVCIGVNDDPSLSASTSRSTSGQNNSSSGVSNANSSGAPLSSSTCTHQGVQYTVDQSFTLGCELRCLCRADGQVDCAPRCYADPGYDERFCYFVADPDDPECCKISICDRQNESVAEHNNGGAERDAQSSANQSNNNQIIIEMAEALNSSSIKLKLVVNAPHSLNTSQLTSLEHHHQQTTVAPSSTPKRHQLSLDAILSGALHSSRVGPNETEHDFVLRHWNITRLTASSVLTSDTNTVDLALAHLESETDYLIFFESKVLNITSNTVFVRTFPVGINHTFRGCFHGSEIIEVNQTFYEGECEYKCVCRDGGLRECEERCPVYVDLVGYENCHWEPSAEDACCQVPVCNHDPSSLFCAPSNGSKSIRYKLGEKWQEDLGGGCMKRTCQCAINSNGTAEASCKGGCPAIPISATEPSEECPSPKVVRPKDRCICPYVVCDNNINPLDLPPENDAEGRIMTPKSANSSFCVFKGHQIAIGETYADGCRAQCLCELNGHLRCKPIQCSRAFGPHTTKCLEWDIDPHFIPSPGNCCPEPKCKNDGSCSFAGIRFANRKQIPQELLPCGKRCLCDNGEIYCENLCPEVPSVPPPNLPCPASMAFRGHLPGDKCCIYWQCRDALQARMKGECEYNDRRYKLGETWDETETGLGRRCQCKLNNGVLAVACNPGNCEPITDRYLQPSSECRVPQVIVPRDPVICPYVICNQTKASAETGELENVDIVAINSTSARVRFTIPTLFVGLLGHAEVHYTTDLQAPRAQWNIAKFARPKRMFDTPNIEYHLGGLRPDTTYFLQVSLIVEPLKHGPSSEIIKLYQPPLPSTTTQAPQVQHSSSTLPPIIMLDMHLTAKAIDANSVRVSWRPFSDKERKFIDGVQLRFKTHEASDWTFSPVLHRSTTEHILDNLEAGASYAVDIIFASAEGIVSNIVSNKPAVVDVPALPISAYQFTPHIYPDDVAMSEDGMMQVEVRNLPRPVSKFINIVKLCYENLSNGEIRYSFIAVDEQAHFSFGQLEQNTRYKLWIDLYLTNGQMVSSNAIDVLTKFHKNFDDNDIGALISLGQFDKSKFLVSAMVCSAFVFVAGAICMVASCVFLRKHHSTAAISRPCMTEAAYDNPTYKTFEAGEKTCLEMSDTLSKSSTLPK